MKWKAGEATMKAKMMQRLRIYANMSLRMKLKLFMSIMLIPMVCLVIGLIIRFSTYTDQYTPIVKDINIANKFDMHFKEEVDYTMYRIAIGSQAFEESDIEAILSQTKHYLEQLKAGTSLESNRKQVTMAQRNLALLEKRIYQIKKNCEETGHYDENMSILDNDIYVFTKLITEEIQEYVYYEALELEKVKEAIQADINNMLSVSLIILVVVLIITWTLVILISDSISKPLQHLCELTKQVGSGDFSMQKINGRGDEVATLERSFNTMVGKIEELVANVRSEQVNLRRTELKLLQAQINPHFLYNTLDTIIWMAEDGQSEEVVEIVGALSDFFRVSLSKGRDYITLKEEESHVKSYLQIQQFRYADILEYEIDIPEELGEYNILKLTLQPIVENAIYHGVKQKRGKSKIMIQGSYKENHMLLTVEDNGIGIQEEKLKQIRLHLEKENPEITDRGFGLANVNARIRLNYGREYGVSIDSTCGVGTKVSMILPVDSYSF